MKRKLPALDSFRQKTRRLPPDVCRHINGYIFLNHPDTMRSRRQYRQSLLQNAPPCIFKQALDADDDDLDVITCIGCGNICYIERKLTKIGHFITEMAHEQHLNSLLIDDSCEHYTLAPHVKRWITQYQHGYHDLCHACSETPGWRSYMEEGQCAQCYPD